MWHYWTISAEFHSGESDASAQGEDRAGCINRFCLKLFYRNGWSRRRDQESEKHGLVEVVRLHSYSADSERHHRKRLQGNIIVLVLKYALDL
jgi:hypothetical protein